MNEVHEITAQFEHELEKYTGAPFAVALDNCSNAIFLSLKYENIKDQIVMIPNRTYPSVPCEIIHAGGIVRFYKVPGNTMKGSYPLTGTRTIDSSLRFTANMYIPNTFMCLSFTGPYKHLKLGKGGAILTDDAKAAEWFRRSRFSGRNACSYLVDEIDMLGWNFYMMPEIATLGIHLMKQFYDKNGEPKNNPDVELPYPDLSKFEIYKT